LVFKKKKDKKKVKALPQFYAEFTGI